jgi:nifR3 family TIM-barrel protein
MQKGFWEKLEKPFLVLAPMADVTDAAFRRLIAKYSKPGFPYVTYTEFVSADGLFCGDARARELLMKDLLFTEAERPIIAQFFTARPELMEKAARLAVELGFDGVDINMGCPDRGIEKQGAGAALIKDPGRAQELIYAAQQGAGRLPVSIKTRLGYNRDELEVWLPVLLEAGPAAIAIHARTRKEMSNVQAHWDAISRAVILRDKLGSETFIVGNGDVETPQGALSKAAETGVDGVMIGRGIFGNPFLFLNLQSAQQTQGPANKEEVKAIERTLKVMVEHTKLFEELLSHKHFAIMKKHYKAYVHGWSASRGRDGAKELRLKLMEAENAHDVETVVKNYLSTIEG